MPTPPRVITLLTDFGTADHFAAAMKGVIAGIAPAARVIDITHEVAPFRIEQARFLLRQSWNCFPARTIHVAVVDPGVGTARRPLLVAAGGHFFIAPDNGLLTDFLAMPGAKARAITNTKLFRQPVSRTFHGRDVFAPVAAHLARGFPPARVGPLINAAIRSSAAAVVRTGRRYWQGEVVHVDRFGNLITNLTPAEIPELLLKSFILRVGFEELRGLARDYAEAELAALIGSHGGIEIAAREASAAQRLGCGVGSPVEIEIP